MVAEFARDVCDFGYKCLFLSIMKRSAAERPCTRYRLTRNLAQGVRVEHLDLLAA